MIKSAQIKAIWPQIYQKLKNPPPGLNLGTFPSKLPPMNKFVFDSSAPSDKSNAIGYVTTEDTDNDGKIDSIHIVLPNLERQLADIKPQDLQSNDPQVLYKILAPFVELIAHEMGHIEDYKKESDNPFPGGESKAENAAEQAVKQIYVKATNIANTNIFLRSSSMKKEILNKLVKLASDLDEKGAFGLSDEVMVVAKKVAQQSDIAGVDFVPPAVEKAKEDTAKMRDVYYAKGHTSPGSITRPGDPYTYEEVSPGKIKVVSAPYEGVKSLGAIIDDFREKERAVKEQAPKAAPSLQPELVRPLSPEVADPYSIDIDAEKATDMYVKLVAEFGRLLNKYGVSVEMADQIARVTSSPNLIYKEVVDIFDNRVPSEVNNMMQKVLQNHKKYSEALKNQKLYGSKARGLNKADDMGVEDLAKDASVNAIFWTPNEKSPFGR